jgi:hypothetical protein
MIRKEATSNFKLLFWAGLKVIKLFWPSLKIIFFTRPRGYKKLQSEPRSKISQFLLVRCTSCADFWPIKYLRLKSRAEKIA